MDACTALAHRGVIVMGFDRKGSTNTEKERDELGCPKHRRAEFLEFAHSDRCAK